MSITGSAGGSTSFITFDKIKMLMSWHETSNRAAETFLIVITASISNFNFGSPFNESS